jgi:hypothetical protein
LKPFWRIRCSQRAIPTPALPVRASAYSRARDGRMVEPVGAAAGAQRVSRIAPLAGAAPVDRRNALLAPYVRHRSKLAAKNASSLSSG